MVETWRLIGWHLGIEDQYNVCESLEHLEACFHDYMQWTPVRLRTCRECTHVLQAAAARGFGVHLPLGEHYWKGFLCMLPKESYSHGFGSQEMRVLPLPGMVELAQVRSRLLGRSDRFNAMVRWFILWLRDTYLNRPRLADKLQTVVFPFFASLNDRVLWQIISAAFRTKEWMRKDRRAVRLKLAALVIVFFLLARRRM